MKRINVLLLDEQEKFFETYKKENQASCMDEAINNMIKEFADLLKASQKPKRK